MSKGIREAPGKALIGDLAREAGDRTEGAFSECILATVACGQASPEIDARGLGLRATCTI